MEWWFNNTGLNMLKGVEGDASNPPRLVDTDIIHFVRTIPASRASYNRLVPFMLPEEQARLAAITCCAAQFIQPDFTRVEDDFQASQNKVGIYTTGPRGGSRIGGNL